MFRKGAKSVYNLLFVGFWILAGIAVFATGRSPILGVLFLASPLRPGRDIRDLDRA